MYLYNYFLVIIIILIGIIYYFHLLYLKKNNSEMIILQKNNPNKITIEDLLEHKSPSIFTGMIENWKVKDDKNITKTEYDYNTELFNIPLCVFKKYKHIILPPQKKTNIIKELSIRKILFILEGEIRLFLFPPDQKIIPNEKNKNIAKYNFFKDNEQYKNIKYLEIKMAEGNIIYIPKDWWYCYRVETYTEILSVISESILSLPLKKIL